MFSHSNASRQCGFTLQCFTSMVLHSNATYQCDFMFKCITPTSFHIPIQHINVVSYSNNPMWIGLLVIKSTSFHIDDAILCEGSHTALLSMFNILLLLYVCLS